MKANAPDKIYYAPYGDIREDYPITDNDIEYIRTDAFVEKMCDFLKENARDYFKVDWFQHEWCFERDQLIKDFKKYMKGK